MVFSIALVALAAEGTAADGLRERAFKDLDTAVIAAQGVPSMTHLSEGQRFSVVKIWATLTPVAALLHVEAGYHLLQNGQDKAGVQHLLLARLMADWNRWRFILEYLSTEGKELAYKQLRRDVYLTIAWILQSAVEEDELKEHLQLARKNLPVEAEIWLASGSAEELYAEPTMVKRLQQTNTRVPRDTWNHTMREWLLQKAEEYHREAIARDPALAEAHVRLGRVLQQRGKLDDARGALEAARRLESPGEVSYLATLFLAGVTEEANKRAPAFDLYAELVERWPECQSGHLGLSRAHSARGNGQAALDALKPLWKDPERRACFDAWSRSQRQPWRRRAAAPDARRRCAAGAAAAGGSRGARHVSQVVVIRSGLRTDHGRVRDMVKGLRVSGMTSAIDASYTGMTLQQDADRPTMMLVFTDGLDTQSWLTPDAVLDTARQSVAVTYAVVAGDGVKPFTAPKASLLSDRARRDPSARFLWDLVQAGGGLFMNAEATNQLERRFTEALDSFRQRYVLTYVPRGVERKGWHPVAIAVKDRRYRIRARPGYFVP